MSLTITVDASPGMLADSMAAAAKLARVTGCSVKFIANDREFRVLASGRDGYSVDPAKGVGSVEYWEPGPDGYWVAVAGVGGGEYKDLQNLKIVSIAPLYETGHINGQAYIRCLTCNAVSFNPHDIREKYCGQCHCFHGSGRTE